jgi:hypothetical protein
MGCAQVRYGQTGIGQAIDNPVTQEFAWGEVYCGQGTVCAEVEVLRVDFEDRDGGRVEVTLHNRTGERVAVQIGLEILAANGTRLDKSTFQDLPLQPRQEAVWEMPGIYKKGARIRVSLRTR